MNLFQIASIFIFLYSAPCWGQTISFSDLELKRFLISEISVDTTQDGISFSHDLKVDVNGDGEIQISEALSVTHLALEDFFGEYAIESLQDLNAFRNLQYLKMLYLRVERVANLELDSLTTLWIADGTNMRVIDVSNLPGLTKVLRIEGLTALDTLNIQNGTVAEQFSLFYTQNTKFACVDSIAAEYDAFAVFAAMQPGVFPSVDCSLVGIEEEDIAFSFVRVFPNPSGKSVTIESPFAVDEVRILDEGETLVFRVENTNEVDVSFLDSGIYFFSMLLDGRHAVERVVIAR